MTHAGLSVLMAACANRLHGSDGCEGNFIADGSWKCELQDAITVIKVESFAWLCETRGSLSFDQIDAGSSLAHGAGLTALHYAARRGDVEIVSLLLESWCRSIISKMRWA